MGLNEMFKEQEGVIAPTDSRFRSDIRGLELGDLGKRKIKLIFKKVFIVIIYFNRGCNTRKSSPGRKAT